MNDFDQFEKRLGAALRSDADASVGSFEASSIAGAAIAASASTRPAARFGRGRGMTLLVAATLLLVGGALAAGSGFLRRPSIVPPLPAPSFAVVATASPDATTPSSSELASPTPVPSLTAAPITWTQASLKEDWSAPVRTEPGGRPIDVPILLKIVVKGTCPDDCSSSSTSGHLADPTGDTGSNALPWADIKDVGFCGDTGTCLSIGFVSDPPLRVDPSQQWFAYGVVVDTDGDGVADWRYGVDNEPVGTPGSYGDSPTRWWRTDLHTGRTESTVRHATWEGSGPFWGNHGDQNGGSGLSFGGDTTAGVRGAVPKRFYVWTSVIQDGRVVATDNAPDAGWLVPSANAKP